MCKFQHTNVIYFWVFVLPSEIASAESLSVFKKKLKMHLLNRAYSCVYINSLFTMSQCFRQSLYCTSEYQVSDTKYINNTLLLSDYY